MAEPTLHQPPFPPLVWDRYFWVGEVKLDFWAGYQSRGGPYGSISANEGSDGTTRVYLATVGKQPTPPTPEQVRAFQYLLDNEQAVGNSVLYGIFAEYPGLREAYGVDFDDEEEGVEEDSVDFDDEAEDEDEAEEVMPAIERAEQLRKLIGLSTIHILAESSGGVAYIGFEFGCIWDEEHGLGVMTHQDRMVEVGGADTSFESWVASRDAKSRT